MSVRIHVFRKQGSARQVMHALCASGIGQGSWKRIREDAGNQGPGRASSWFADARRESFELVGEIETCQCSGIEMALIQFV